MSHDAQVVRETLFVSVFAYLPGAFHALRAYAHSPSYFHAYSSIVTHDCICVAKDSLSWLMTPIVRFTMHSISPLLCPAKTSLYIRIFSMERAEILRFHLA